MIISITGAHCTGKTTLINHLKTLPEFKKVKFLTSSSKDSAKYGLNHNEGGDFLSQMYFACRDIKQLIEVRNSKNLVIFDRSIIDTFIYSVYLYNKGKISEQQMAVIVGMYQSSGECFDKVLLSDVSFDLVEEEGRSMDKQFQADIKTLTDGFYLENIKIDPLSAERILYLPNDLEGRVEMVKKVKKELEDLRDEERREIARQAN